TAVWRSMVCAACWVLLLWRIAAFRRQPTRLGTWFGCAAWFDLLSVKLLVSDLCQVSGEAIQGFGPATHMLVADRDRLEDGLMHGELRLLTEFGEGHRHQRFVPGLACCIFKGIGEDESLRLHDLAINA